MYDVAKEVLQSCYNVLMPSAEKAIRAEGSMKYDDVNYLKVLRYVLMTGIIWRLCSRGY